MIPEHTQANTLSIPKEDQINKIKTLYDAGVFEIFWKNFLAGASRALGGIVLYIIFVSFFSIIFVQSIMPKLDPFMQQMTQIGNSIQNLQQVKIPSLQLELPTQYSE